MVSADRYFEFPTGSLQHAATVMLDWNVSARLEVIHNAQFEGRKVTVDAAQVLRITNLAHDLPDGVRLVTALSAAEPEITAKGGNFNVNQFNRRANIPAYYLGPAKDYLVHLLEGGDPDGRPIPASADDEDDTAVRIRPWLASGYAVLLKAADLHRRNDGSAGDRVDALRFWLEHDLKALPSREAWLGFVLLGGKPQFAQEVRALMKIDQGGRTAIRSIWGAAWDLMYTRLPAMAQSNQFNRHIRSPVAFVSEDKALARVMSSISAVGIHTGDTRAQFVAEEMNTDVLTAETLAAMEPYLERERARISRSSRGATNAVMSRAKNLSRRIERDWPVN